MLCSKGKKSRKENQFNVSSPDKQEDNTFFHDRKQRKRGKDKTFHRTGVRTLGCMKGIAVDPNYNLDLVLFISHSIISTSIKSNKI